MINLPFKGASDNPGEGPFFFFPIFGLEWRNEEPTSNQILFDCDRCIKTGFSSDHRQFQVLFQTF